MLLGSYDRNQKVIYEHINGYDQIPVKVICLATTTAYPQTDRFEKHRHQSLEIIWADRSVSVMIVEGKKIRIEPDQIYIVNSCDIHEVVGEECSSPWYGYTFQLSSRFMSHVHPGTEQLRFYADESTQKKMKPLLKEIAGYVLSDTGRNRRIICSLCEALTEVLCTYAAQDSVEKKIPDQRISRIIQYLNEACLTDINYTETAEKFGISYAYMARVFRQYLGVTPGQYVNQQRVRRSIEDLCNGDLNISEISYQYGFPNAGAYIREFRRLKGMTPSEYRKTVVKK